MHEESRHLYNTSYGDDEAYRSHRFGATPERIRESSAVAAAEPGQIWPISPRNWSSPSHTWPKLHQFWPISAQVWPISAQVWPRFANSKPSLARHLAEIEPTLVDFGRSRANVDQSRQNSPKGRSRPAPHFGRSGCMFWPASAGFATHLVMFWEASFDPRRSGFGRPRERHTRFGTLIQQRSAMGALKRSSKGRWEADSGDLRYARNDLSRRLGVAPVPLSKRGPPELPPPAPVGGARR